MSNRVNERILQSYATPFTASQIVDSSWVIALILVGTTIALIPVFIFTVNIGLGVKNKIRQLRKPTTITPEPYEAETVQNSSILLPTMEMLKRGEEIKQMDTIMNNTNKNENQINIIYWQSQPKQHQKRINIHLPSDSEYPDMIKTLKAAPRFKTWQEKGLQRNSLDTIISTIQKLSSNNEIAKHDDVVMSYERPKKNVLKKLKEKATRKNQISPISLRSAHDQLSINDESNAPFHSVLTPHVQNYSDALEDDLSAAASSSSIILQDSIISPAAASPAASSSSIDVTTSEIFKLGTQTKRNKISKKDITFLTKSQPPTPIKAEVRNKSLIWQSSQLPQLEQTETNEVQADVGMETRRGRGIGLGVDIGIGVGRSSPRSLSFSSVTTIETKNKTSVKNVKWLPTVNVNKDSLVEDQAKIGARIAEMDWVKQEEELFLDQTAGALAYFSLANARMQLVSNKDDVICPNEECGCQEPSGSQQKKK